MTRCPRDRSPRPASGRTGAHSRPSPTERCCSPWPRRAWWPRGLMALEASTGASRLLGSPSRARPGGVGFPRETGMSRPRLPMLRSRLYPPRRRRALVHGRCRREALHPVGLAARLGRSLVAALVLAIAIPAGRSVVLARTRGSGGLRRHGGAVHHRQQADHGGQRHLPAGHRAAHVLLLSPLLLRESLPRETGRRARVPPGAEPVLPGSAQPGQLLGNGSPWPRGSPSP